MRKVPSLSLSFPSRAGLNFQGLHRRRRRQNCKGPFNSIRPLVIGEWGEREAPLRATILYSFFCNTRILLSPLWLSNPQSPSSGGPHTDHRVLSLGATPASARVREIALISFKDPLFSLHCAHTCTYDYSWEKVKGLAQRVVSGKLKTASIPSLSSNMAARVCMYE